MTPPPEALLEEDDEPICLLFGTGYGLVDEIMAEADYTLEPIVGPTDYNHLSVRSAASIILDRLRSVRPTEAPRATGRPRRKDAE